MPHMMGTHAPVGTNELNAQACGCDLVDQLIRNFDTAGAADVRKAIQNAIAANVPWLKIFQVIWPLVVKFTSGQPVTVQDIIDAIKQLFPAPVPSPAPGPVISGS